MKMQIVKHFIIIVAGLATMVSQPGAAEPAGGIQFFPEEASSAASQVDYLYFFLITVCGLVSLGIAVTMVYFIIRYHHTRDVDRTNPTLNHIKLEVAWSLIPLAIFMLIFLWGGWLYFHLEKMPAANALPIYAIGQQWMWTFQHPGGQREINDLHVPLGQDVKLIMTSEDVIHSFYVPAFRVKQDVLPSRYTYAWFRPTKLGTYHLFCAEYCGTLHSTMRGMVYVMRPEDYQRWLADHLPAQSLAEKGQRLFNQLGCASCHIANAGVKAPLLQNLYGRKVRLDNGQMINADDQYIRDSILLPQKQIVAGYPPNMPTFRGIVSQAELLALVEYVKSLHDGPEGRTEQ